MTRGIQFEDVDALSLAALQGSRGVAANDLLDANRLGPIFEIAHHTSSGQLPVQLTETVLTDQAMDLVHAISTEEDFWSGPNEIEEFGIVRTRVARDTHENQLTLFLQRARTAGQKVAGLQKGASNQLIAAIHELENNISEHADAPESGVIAFKAEPGTFEFAVADHGIGVLKSLRKNGKHPNVCDEGTALRAAITEGISRFGQNIGRGLGFRALFLGLMNLNGALRFRSGDHALTMDGTSPTVAVSRIAQKAPSQGFLASVCCNIFT